MSVLQGIRYSPMPKCSERATVISNTRTQKCFELMALWPELHQ